jgi:drug/metabolite transporter (DMT)-like permease
MEPKAGWKTSEYWLSLAAIVVGMLLASGAIGEATALGKVLAFVASALTAIGYTYVRGSVKKNAKPPE